MAIEPSRHSIAYAYRNFSPVEDDAIEKCHDSFAAIAWTGKVVSVLLIGMGLFGIAIATGLAFIASGFDADVSSGAFIPYFIAPAGAGTLYVILGYRSIKCLVCWLDVASRLLLLGFALIAAFLLLNSLVPRGQLRVGMILLAAFVFLLFDFVLVTCNWRKFRADQKAG